MQPKAIVITNVRTSMFIQPKILKNNGSEIKANKTTPIINDICQVNFKLDDKIVIPLWK
jgi:hypothetical protein